MKTPLYKQFENAAPVGVYAMNNWGGLAILAINEAEETTIAAWHYGTGYQNVRCHKIQYSSAGRPFIRKNGTRFYFDQIMRTGAGA